MKETGENSGEDMVQGVKGAMRYAMVLSLRAPRRIVSLVKYGTLSEILSR